MQSINALSLAPDVNHWLANTREPRILHVFEHACNLINERREILSVVTPQIGNGPFNLVVGKELHFSEHLTLDSSIFSSAALLKLGTLTIHTTGAKPWNPRPDWEMLHNKAGEILDRIKQFPIADYLKHSDLSILQPLASSLSSALVDSDLSTVTSTASQLAGLGIGLTPSGDDFMVGALYAAWILHPPKTARVLAQAMENPAAPLTTSLSAAWLRAAGRGEAGIVWHEFFEALLSNDSLRIQKTLKDILAVGETSGEDALAGFMGVFEALMKKAGSLHE